MAAAAALDCAAALGCSNAASAVCSRQQASCVSMPFRKSLRPASTFATLQRSAHVSASRSRSGASRVRRLPMRAAADTPTHACDLDALCAGPAAANATCVTRQTCLHLACGQGVPHLARRARATPSSPPACRVVTSHPSLSLTPALPRRLRAGRRGAGLARRIEPAGELRQVRACSLERMGGSYETRGAWWLGVQGVAVVDAAAGAAADVCTATRSTLRMQPPRWAMCLG